MMQERETKGSAAGKKSSIAFLKGRYKRSLDNGRVHNRPMKHQQNFGAPLKSSFGAPLRSFWGVHCTPCTPCHTATAFHYLTIVYSAL